MKQIYFSMDCERLNSETCVKGPTTPEKSAASIVNFVKRLQHFHTEIGTTGPSCELFVTPAAAQMHQNLLQEMVHNTQVTIGLHIHLSSFRKYHNYSQKELPNLPYNQQLQLIQQAIADFKSSLGFTPSSFRAGMAAANADTFQALVAAGITKGSCTVPGLKKERYNFDWSDSPTTPHTIKPSGFFNIPLTGNLWIDNHPNNTLFPLPLTQDLIAIYSHNWVDFSPHSEAIQTLNTVLENLKTIETPIQLVTSHNWSHA